MSSSREANIRDSIEMLSDMRDRIIFAMDGETYHSRLLMWLIEQLQQSILVLDSIRTEKV